MHRHTSHASLMAWNTALRSRARQPEWEDVQVRQATLARSRARACRLPVPTLVRMVVKCQSKVRLSEVELLHVGRNTCASQSERHALTVAYSQPTAH